MPTTNTQQKLPTDEMTLEDLRAVVADLVRRLDEAESSLRDLEVGVLLLSGTKP